MTDQQKFQEKQYEFPYHHLPVIEDNYWHIGRWWHNSLEYLGILSRVKEIITDLNPINVLDFGCGDGRLILELKKDRVLNIVGLDISETALKYAKVFNQNSNSNVQFVSSFDEIINNKFDLIVAMEVLEHIQENELPVVIEKLSKLLEDKGKFVVTVPTLNKQPIPSKHFRHYNLDLLREHVSPYFNIDNAEHLLKLGFMKNLIEHLMINRFFILNWKPARRLLKIIYEKFVLKATEKSGSNLVVILSKRR